MKTAPSVSRIKTRARPSRSTADSQRRFIKGVVNTVKNHGMSEAMLEAQAIEMRKQKKKEEEEKALLDSLFRDAQNVREAGGA